MQCTGIAKNGRQCEREAGHDLGGGINGHSNRWCSRCGENLKAVVKSGRKNSWCFSCQVAVAAEWRRTHLKAHRASVSRARRGEGQRGLVSRMCYLLSAARKTAKKHGYLPPNITPERAVAAWKKQRGRCAWTGRPVSLLQAKLEHNHQTGEFRGFVMQDVNVTEGSLIKLTPQEQALFIERALPETYALILQRAMVAA
jgi:Recombination endonuclease VII